MLQEVDEKSFGQARALRGILRRFCDCKKLGILNLRHLTAVPSQVEGFRPLLVIDMAGAVGKVRSFSMFRPLAKVAILIVRIVKPEKEVAT